MAEEINKKLLACSDVPRVGYLALRAVTIMNEVTEELEGLTAEDFSEVYKFSRGLNLPRVFREELEFHYMHRGFKTAS